MPLRVLLVGLDDEEDRQLRAWLQRPHLVLRSCDADNAPAQALRMLPSVLLVDARQDARTGVVERALERCRSVTVGVVWLRDVDDATPCTDQGGRVHLHRPFNRARLLQAVAQATQPWDAPVATHWHARQWLEEAETLLELALDLASPAELPERLQHCADAARHLTGAAFAALFRHGGLGRHRLAGLSGLPHAAFHGLDAPGDTLLLAPTFAGERVIRCDDVHVHPRYGWSPDHGVPPGHPPVRSYLAVPVATREGRLLGALLLGHGEPGVFTARSERLAGAIAAQAAAAIEHHLLHAGDAAAADADGSERVPSSAAARHTRVSPGRGGGGLRPPDP